MAKLREPCNEGAEKFTIYCKIFLDNAFPKLRIADGLKLSLGTEYVGVDISQEHLGESDQ
jgi:hypothetical protein